MSIVCADEQETLRLCREHVRSIRATHCLSSAKIVLIPENNLGNEAQFVSDKLIKMPNITILCENDKSYGVMTSRGMPERYVYRTILKFGEQAIVYHRDVVTGNPYVLNKTDEQRRNLSKQEFERQLRCFRKIFVLPKSLTSSVRVANSGLADKDGQRSSSLRDDMCMAFLFGVYWSGQHLGDLGMIERGFNQRLHTPMSTENEERERPTTMPAPKRRRVNGMQRYAQSESSQSTR